MAIKITCPYVQLHPDGKAPTRGSAYAAGHDFYCIAGVDHLEDPEQWQKLGYYARWLHFKKRGAVTIAPGASYIFRTGIKIAIDEDYMCKFEDRSGLGAVKKITHSAGVIDPDFRGEWFISVFNFGDKGVEIKPGDKIIQGIFIPRVEAEFPKHDTLPDTVRSNAGFGSTGA